MRFQVVSTVRSAAVRSRVLSLAKTCSMGLRSGAVGGQEEELCAAVANGAADGLAFMRSEIVHDDDCHPWRVSAPGIARHRPGSFGH